MHGTYPPDSPEAHLRAALDALGLGDDPETRRTPELFADFLRGLAPGRPAPRVEALATRSEDPVVLRDLPFYSLCAHHLLPFFGHATVAYRPAGRLLGLGSIARLLRHRAERPQLQERLTAELAEALWEALQPRSLVVVLEARHLCMEMRGARSAGRVLSRARRGEPDPELESLLRG